MPDRLFQGLFDTALTNTIAPGDFLLCVGTVSYTHLDVYKRQAVYLAKADMPNCVYPPDTAGLWQWEKVT